MTESKKNLIDKLVKMYPYGRKWFEQKKETVLWAMLNSWKPPKQKVVVDKAPIRVIDGLEYVKVDSGLWELVID
ncbi:MAG: hypothetical protein NC310_00405 [Roseburia sp.]|nr:hypothetical protein [Anaeroplasma bactoclasticum]MCM1195513.1 hypothetical protein [Roseburia sp.]MCM1556892.1 hypothetical protein [Anaeroplasma bactoclasticum]